MVVWIIGLLAFTMVSVSAIACSYYIFLAVASMVLSKRKSHPSENPIVDFAIVLPAHDEEDGIASVLDACTALDYPKELFTIYVVADNCTDKTASIAKGIGVCVLERTDASQRGKGYALSWAFPKVLKAGHDAVVILDADSYLDDMALRHFDHLIRKGHKVLQASDIPSNPDVSPTTYAVAVGFALENDYFYAPKSKLGLSVLLRGTGMALHKEILERHPWGAHSITEDAEYSINLINAGIEVIFVSEVSVKSAFPVDVNQLKVQRTRWAGGNFSLSKKNAFKLLYRGFTEKRLILADLGLTMLVLSRPIILGVMVLAFLFSALASLLSVWGSTVLLSAAILICILQTSYFFLGIWSFGITQHRIDLLKKTPAIVGRLLIITVLSICNVDKGFWARTPRNNGGQL
jgi:cellulose synthase/poly-beta-1,6-N-acetylglucosamine synthase-like glycosyltransferase